MTAQHRERTAPMLAKICGALSHPTRILLICELADQSRNVNDLAETLNTPQSSISRHLKILCDQGLVHSQRQGQFVEYKLVDDRVITALQTMRMIVLDVLREQTALAHAVSESRLIQSDSRNAEEHIS